MRKFIFTLIFCLILSIGFTSCNRDNAVVKKNGYPKAVYRGAKWDLIQVNESIYTMVPGINVESSVKPVVFNVKNFNHGEITE